MLRLLKFYAEGRYDVGRFTQYINAMYSFYKTFYGRNLHISVVSSKKAIPLLPLLTRAHFYLQILDQGPVS